MSNEIQRQSTSFAYRMSSDHEEWRDARDFDYDDGRPSRADLAAEQAEDDFWEEKERDYPRGYGPPQTGDEDHDYPGWLYVDDEAPDDEDDDFDPYEDEFVDGQPLPFDTPIYNPGGGYDDYDKGLNNFEAEEDSAPDIEKFSAAKDFDCDGIHNWGPNERCEDCGKEDTREPGDEKPVPKFPKKGRTNPFDRRVAWGDRTHPPAPQKKTKEPQRAIRNDDVKIMRHSETGLGYDAIVRVNEHGGYDVIKPLQRKSFRYADTPATTPATTNSTTSPTYGPTPMPTGLTNAITNAQSANGQSYQYGGNDCSGYMSNIYNDLTGKNERFTTDSDFTSLGFQPGYDPNSHFNIGTNGLPGTEGHMAGELGGVPVESASPTGHHPGAPGVMYGGDAYSPTNPMFTQQYHLPNDLIINNSGKTSGRQENSERIAMPLKNWTEAERPVTETTRNKPTGTPQAKKPSPWLGETPCVAYNDNTYKFDHHRGIWRAVDWSGSAKFTPLVPRVQNNPRTHPEEANAVYDKHIRELVRKSLDWEKAHPTTKDRRLI